MSAGGWNRLSSRFCRGLWHQGWNLIILYLVVHVEERVAIARLSWFVTTNVLLNEISGFFQME
jgi:hypothetical protein